MINRGLLDRIRTQEKTPGRMTGISSAYEIDSVVSHLQRLLNARQGTTLMDTDYGMPDLTHVSSRYPDNVYNVELMIQRTIEKYEPRLRNVSVVFLFHDDRTYAMNFRISATLVAENNTSQVWLESTMNPEGRVTVN